MHIFKLIFIVLMKHFFLPIFFLFLLTSCDDGDVIVTTFDFDDISLQYCQTSNAYVFYKINNTNLESLSFVFQTQNDSILTTESTILASLEVAGNVVNYRTYNAEVPPSFFCSNVPPSNPRIIRDYVSVQGQASLFTRIVDTTLVGVGNEQDTLYVYKTSIEFSNIRMVSDNETITQETLILGSLEVTGH